MDPHNTNSRKRANASASFRPPHAPNRTNDDEWQEEAVQGKKDIVPDFVKAVKSLSSPRASSLELTVEGVAKEAIPVQLQDFHALVYPSLSSPANQHLSSALVATFLHEQVVVRHADVQQLSDNLADFRKQSSKFLEESSQDATESESATLIAHNAATMASDLDVQIRLLTVATSLGLVATCKLAETSHGAFGIAKGGNATLTAAWFKGKDSSFLADFLLAPIGSDAKNQIVSEVVSWLASFFAAPAATATTSALLTKLPKKQLAVFVVRLDFLARQFQAAGAHIPSSLVPLVQTAQIFPIVAMDHEEEGLLDSPEDYLAKAMQAWGMQVRRADVEEYCSSLERLHIRYLTPLFLQGQLDHATVYRIWQQRQRSRDSGISDSPPPLIIIWDADNIGPSKAALASLFRNQHLFRIRAHGVREKKASWYFRPNSRTGRQRKRRFLGKFRIVSAGLSEEADFKMLLEIVGNLKALKSCPCLLVSADQSLDHLANMISPATATSPITRSLLCHHVRSAQDVDVFLPWAKLCMRSCQRSSRKSHSWSGPKYHGLPQS